MDADTRVGGSPSVIAGRRGGRGGVRSFLVAWAVLFAAATAVVAVLWGFADRSPGPAAPSARPSLPPSVPSVPVPVWSPGEVPPVTGPVLRIAPEGVGDGTGPDWSTAAPLGALPELMSTATPGTQFWLLADAGPYALTRALVLDHGGTAEAPVVIRGVDAGGAPRPAELVGTRADPYDPKGAPGKDAFRLVSGADHLLIQDLAFRNVGNGCVRIAGPVTGLTVRQVTAANVRRFIENDATGGAPAATVDGLTVTDVFVTGFSRAFARLQYDSRRVLFERVVGDSQGQDGDPFAQGIQLAGTVHDVLIRETTMMNAVSTDGKYWNGDGFSAEKQTYDIRFERTHAAGNTDGGYDIKSQSATLVDVTAEDNKRNYRFWGNVTVQGCRGIRPNQRGGSGTQDQVHATGNAVVTMRDCTFVDDDPRTIVFDVDGSARLTVIDSRVTHAPDGRVSTVEEGAVLETPGLVVD